MDIPGAVAGLDPVIQARSDKLKAAFNKVTVGGSVQTWKREGNLDSKFQIFIQNCLQEYPDLLRDLRQAVTSEQVTTSNLEIIQEKLTVGHQAILKRMLSEAFILIGEPCCSYAWYGLGSYSRGEVLPFSDIEYLWLFCEDDILTKVYFALLQDLIVLQILCVGEKAGFTPDQYPEISDVKDEENTIHKELPNNLDEIAYNLFLGCRDTYSLTGTYPQIVSNLHGRFIAGNKESLWQEYHDTISALFTGKHQENEPKKAKSKYPNLSAACADILFETTVNKFNRDWGQETITPDRAIDIKDELASYLTFLGVLLRYIHPISGQSTIQIIQSLVSSKIIPSALADQLIIAWKDIHVLRFKLQLKSKTGENFFKPNESLDELPPLNAALSLIRKVYAHLAAAKTIQASATVSHLSQAALACAGSYYVLDSSLVQPKIPADLAQATLSSVISQPVDAKVVSLLLECGAKATIPDMLEELPARAVLKWSEQDPDAAKSVWTQLFKAGADPEHFSMTVKKTLLDESVDFPTLSTFGVLCHLGCGYRADVGNLLHLVNLEMRQPNSPMKEYLPMLVQQNRALGWELALQDLFQTIPPDDQVYMIESARKGTGYLTPLAASQLFDPQTGEIKSSNHYGKHSVAKIDIKGEKIYVKFFPELPGMEEAVRSLAYRLFGYGTAHSELFRFKDNQNRVYSILMSQEIRGENLQNILSFKSYPKKSWMLDAIDLYQFTQMLFLTLLVNPEDGKPDNFILSSFTNSACEQAYQLVCIDNDHSLVDPFIREGDSKKVQVKTIIYCLNQMLHKLHPKAVQEFLTKHPETELSEWLAELQRVQDRYENMFSISDRKNLMKEESVTQIPFPPNSIAKMFERWYAIKETLMEHPEITGMELLKDVEPFLGLKYEDTFSKHDVPLDRFMAVAITQQKSVFNRPNNPTELLTSRQLLRTQNIDEKELVTTDKFGPRQARVELERALGEKKQPVDQIVAQIYKGNTWLFENSVQSKTRSNVLKQIDWSLMDTTKQTYFFKKIVSLGDLSDITLKGCQCLSSDLLSNLFRQCGEKLVTIVLDARAVDKQPQYGLEVGLKQYNPTIERLVIAGISQFITFGPLGLTRLKYLQILECPTLESISIDAPRQVLLLLSHLPSLSALSFASPQSIKELQITDCPKLTNAILVPLLRACFELTSTTFRLEGCPLAKRPPLDAEVKKNKMSSKHLALATENLSNGDYFLAVSMFNKILEHDPKNVLALLGKSCAIYSIGSAATSLACGNYMTTLMGPMELKKLWESQIDDANRQVLKASSKANAGSSLNLYVVYTLGLCRFLRKTDIQAAATRFEQLEKKALEFKVSKQHKDVALSHLADYFYFELEDLKRAKTLYDAVIKHSNQLQLSHKNLLIVTRKKLSKLAEKEGNTRLAASHLSAAIELPIDERQKLVLLLKLMKFSKRVQDYQAILNSVHKALQLTSVKAKGLGLVSTTKSALGRVIKENPQNAEALVTQGYFILIEMAKNKDEDAFKAVGDVGDLLFRSKGFKLPKIALLCYEFYLANVQDDNSSELSRANKYLNYGKLLLKIGPVDNQLKQTCLDYFSRALLIYTKHEQTHMVELVDTHRQLGDFYESFDTTKSVSHFRSAWECLKKVVPHEDPYENAKMNLNCFGARLGLNDLEFDKNNTCILGIDDEYSLHLTYEPNTQRLYMYSPLLDGLPKDFNIAYELYQNLLEASMLGGNTSGCGVGVAVKEELILMHFVLNMADTDRYSLHHAAVKYVEVIDYWRTYCDAVVNQKPIPKNPNFNARGIPRSYLRAKQVKLDEKLSLGLETPATIARKLADIQLQELGKELGLDDLVFDENNGCVLGVDDSFSLHITYEPEARSLFLYSPLLDGLPSTKEQRFALYEILLEGAMLGGQVAGGGVGVATEEELILLHFSFEVTSENKNAMFSLKGMAPLFVETVEKWRKSCAARFPSVISRFAPKDTGFFSSIFKQISHAFLAFFGFDAMINSVLPQQKKETTQKNVCTKFEKQAEARMETQNYFETVESCDYVLSFDATNTKMLLLKARALRWSGRVQEAIEVNTYVLKLEPTNKSAISEMAELFGQLEQRKLAERYMQQLMELYPNDLSALFTFAKNLTLSGQYEEALKYWQKFEAEHSPWAQHFKWRCYVQLGRSKEADAALQLCGSKFSTEQTDLLMTLHSSRMDAEFKGDYPKALEFLEREGALKDQNSEDSFWVDFYERKAVYQSNMGNYLEALDFYDHALSLPQSPSMLFAMLNKVICLDSLGRYAEALAFCRKAELFLYRPEPFPYQDVLRAVIYARKGDKVQSLRHLSIALSAAQRPDTLCFAHDTAHEVYLDLQDYENAMQHLDKASTLTIPGSPSHIQIQESKACLLATMKQIKECLEVVKYVQERKPLSWKANLASGICQTHLRNFNAAFDDFDKAQKVSKNGKVFVAKGYAYLEQGDPQKALIEVDEALKINPHNQMALQLKQQLVSNQEPVHGQVSTTAPLDLPVPTADVVSPRETLPLLGNFLFSDQFNYQITFKKFRSEIIDFIFGKKTEAPETLIVRLIAYSMRKIDQAILIDAFEFARIRMGVYTNQIKELQNCISLVELADTTKRVYTERSAQIQAVTNEYFIFLRYASTDEEISAAIRKECDTCLVFLSGLKDEMSLGAKWSEKAFFSHLTEQTVFHATGMALHDPKLCFMEALPRAGLFTKHSMANFWEIIWDRLHAMIVKSDYVERITLLKSEQTQVIRQYNILLDTFKFFLQLQKNQSWKDAWLSHPNLLQTSFGGKKGNEIIGYFHTSHSVEAVKRFLYFDEPAGSGGSKLSAVIGSTYFGSTKPLEMTSKELILDAGYQVESTGAIADGLGHFKTEDLNRAIYYAAYRACKLGTRYANLYSDPGTFYAEIFRLFTCLGAAVKQSFIHPHEAGSTTLLLTKVFTTKEKEKVLVAAGIGDCLGLLYTPSTQKLVVLSKPRQYERGGQFSPISLTEKLEENYIQKSWHRITDDSFIFRMTDGAWDLLPHTTKKMADPNKQNRFYLEYTPDIEVLTDILNSFYTQNPSANPRDFRNFLFSLVHKTLKERKEKLSLYQQLTPIKFAFYSNSATATELGANGKTVKAFLAWVQDHDSNFYDLFIKAIEYLNFDLLSIQESTLDDFIKMAIETIQFGDDFALQVESIYPFEMTDGGKHKIGPISASPSMEDSTGEEPVSHPPSKPTKAILKPDLPPTRVATPTLEGLLDKMSKHSVSSVKLQIPSSKPSFDIHECIKNAVGKERWDSPEYQSLFRDVLSHVKTNVAVKKTLQASPDMTVNDLTALVYYTSDLHLFGGKKEDSVFILLNDSLSSKDETKMKPWMPFLYYACRAKTFLKPWKGTAYRGIDKALTSLSDKYKHDSLVVWDGFTSTTIEASVIKSFSEAERGTWMIIEVVEGYELPFSLFEAENEVLLFPNSAVRVTAVMSNEMKKLLKFPVGLDVIHFRQES